MFQNETTLFSILKFVTRKVSGAKLSSTTLKDCVLRIYRQWRIYA